MCIIGEGCPYDGNMCDDFGDWSKNTVTVHVGFSDYTMVKVMRQAIQHLEWCIKEIIEEYGDENCDE